MIKHICMFKMKENANGKSAYENALEMAACLDGFEEKIGSLKKIEVKVNSKEAPDSNYELVLICDFEDMEGFVTSYADDSVLYGESEDELERESAYITNIVEDYVRERAMSADLASIRGDDDLFETVFERYFY